MLGEEPLRGVACVSNMIVHAGTEKETVHRCPPRVMRCLKVLLCIGLLALNAIARHKFRFHININAFNRIMQPSYIARRYMTLIATMLPPICYAFPCTTAPDFEIKLCLLFESKSSEG